MNGWRLSLALWWRRGGWVASAGGALLVLAAVLETVVRPQVLASAGLLERERGAALAALAKPAVAVSPGEANRSDRHAAFVATLARPESVPAMLRTVFSEAAKHGLTIASADYRSGQERAGRYRTYRMVLPVQGSYPRVRSFVDAVLRELPAAALEEAAFRRDGANQATPDARLHFVFYLRDGEGP